MSRRLVALAVVAAVAVASVGTAAGQSSTPTASVETTSLALGQRVLVQGHGWQTGTLVHITLCGNQAANLSADCDVVHEATAGVGPDGSFSMLLTVADPGTACPCVIRVTDAEALGETTVPVTVEGLPMAEPHATPLPDNSQQLEISEARVEGGGDWTSWFGAGSPRTLVLTIHNNGATVVSDPPLNLAFGKGENPTGIVPAPHIGDLAPGQTTTLRVPFGFDTFSWGDYTIKGQIQGPGRSTVFHAKTKAQTPWGLVLIAVVLLQLVLLTIRNRVRRRLHSDQEPEVVEVDATSDVIDAEPDDVMSVASAAVEEDEGVDELGVSEVIPVAALAGSLRADADALLAALAQRSDDMARANAALDQEAASALERIAEDGARHRKVTVERHRLARLNLGTADDQAFELLSTAETSSTQIISDAERRARMLVDRAHADAAALLLRAAPDGFDGVADSAAGADIDIDITDELRETYLPPYEYDPRSDERGS